MPQEKLLMKNLDRFDLYIASVDRKSAFLVTFNTFVLGTLLFKYNDILSLYKYEKIKCLIPIILIICLIAVIVAIFCAFIATMPYLKSGKDIGSYIPLLFFSSIAEMKQETYLKNITNLQDDDFIKDIAIQTHTLALGLKRKFIWINVSKYVTIWITLLSIELCTVLIVIDYLARG